MKQKHMKRADQMRYYAKYLLKTYYSNGGNEDGIAVRLNQYIETGAVNNWFAKRGRIATKIEFLNDARNKINEFIKIKYPFSDLANELKIK